MNYTKGQDPTSLVAVLYRLKKYQYLLYKHLLLHGLNITVALTGDSIAGVLYFRIYWISLNAAYVLEFFLQTLVKRRVMSQNVMLTLNQTLMFASTFSVVSVMRHISFPLSVLSLALNIANRGHDVLNTAAVAAVGSVCVHFDVPLNTMGPMGAVSLPNGTAPVSFFW